MKVPLNWLTKHLQTDARDEDIITRLTSLGLVVDGVTAPGKAFDGFIVARITSAAPHPQADRLQVCQVETGTETLQIVCGAPNARAGLTVVLATEGAVVPSNQMVIGKAVMRGVESRGMLCSAAELGLEGDTQGIIELEEGIPLGTPFAQYMGLDTLILDVDVTPNRGDCLSLRGMARDLAASGVGALAMLQIKVIPATTTETLPVTLSSVAENEACPLFMGRVIKGVKNGPSPQWLQNALRTVGIRSISALVDVTNYMAFDLGRPMHVFDTARLKGGLNVRLSEDGEQLEALDDKTYTLPKGLPVIADDAGLVSLAGIMGGKTSGCSLETTDVFLESAYFMPRA
ncbi:MAG: YtpR family tRNA-binding protein, partial [bacterium]